MYGYPARVKNEIPFEIESVYDEGHWDYILSIPSEITIKTLVFYLAEIINLDTNKIKVTFCSQNDRNIWHFVDDSNYDT